MKKTKTIGLLLVVAFIWGKIAWDVFSTPSIVENETLAFDVQEEVMANESKKPIKLIMIERDPFLGKIRSSKKKAKKATNNIRKVKPKEVPKVIFAWPEIQFKGFVQDKSGGKPKAFVSIDNAFSTWTEGDTLKGLLLNKVSKDSIIVSYAHQSKSIKKNP